MDHKLYDGVFDIEQNAETNQTVAADQVQISNDIGNINTYSSNVHSSDAEETDKLINEEEKEDMIAMEENCKLRDLPYDTCLQSELHEEANQMFSIAPGEGKKPISYLQTNCLKNFQIHTSSQLEKEVIQIQTGILD